MKKIIYTLSSAFVAVLLFASLQASAQTPAITLIQPTGGETWTDNGTYLISWTDNFAGSVVIKLWNGSAIKHLRLLLLVLPMHGTPRIIHLQTDLVRVLHLK